jgi:hypothetical protein
MKIAVRGLSILVILSAVILAGLAAGNAGDFKVGFMYNDGGMRDPFVPSSVQTKTTTKEEPVDDNIPGDLKVEGIMWDPKDPYVIIRDEIYRVGDEVEGITILKIDKDRVTLKKKDRTIVVPLIPEEKGE